MEHAGPYLLLFLGILVISKTFAFKIGLLIMRHISKRRSLLYSSSGWEGEIKAAECSCGYRVEGVNDEELFDQLQIHADHAHPELQPTDEQINELVTSGACKPARS